MKVKTQDLIDTALDWAVAKCEGFKYELYEHNRKKWENGLHRPQHWQPSTNWAQGGPIIEREEIGSFHYIHGFHGPTWSARIGSGGFQQDGPTLLIAAMRCFCASHLGDEVDIPDELV